MCVLINNNYCVDDDDARMVLFNTIPLENEEPTRHHLSTTPPIAILRRIHAIKECSIFHSLNSFPTAGCHNSRGVLDATQ